MQNKLPCGKTAQTTPNSNLGDDFAPNATQNVAQITATSKISPTSPQNPAQISAQTPAAQTSAAQTQASTNSGPTDIRAALQGQNLFDFMRQRCEREGAKAWGLMRHAAARKCPAHLQSYFVVLSREVFAGASFARFLGSVTRHSDKMEIVRRYEFGLSEFLCACGVKTSALLTSRNVGDPRRELMENAADGQHLLALQLGFGFLKISSILVNFGGDITLESLRQIKKIVEESGYDWGMIDGHLREVATAKLRGGGGESGEFAASGAASAVSAMGGAGEGGAAGVAGANGADAGDTDGANSNFGTGSTKVGGAETNGASGADFACALPRIYPRKRREFCVGSDFLRVKRRLDGRVLVDFLGRKIFSSTPLQKLARSLCQRVFGAPPRAECHDCLTLFELLDEVKK